MKILLKTVTDPDFRRAVLDNPEKFGVSVDQNSLPAPVSSADMSFTTLVNDTSSMSVLDISACKSTCTMGPFTIVCDGTTK